MDNVLYWLWLVKHIEQTSKIVQLLEYFNTIENIYKSNEGELSKAVDNKTAYILSDKELDSSRKMYNDAAAVGAHIVTYDSPDYPAQLMDIYDPPYVLYVKGGMCDWSSFIGIAIVGTRKCDNYGRSVTEYFSKELSKNNIVVISGLADGVDSIAARAAIDVGRPTIAVLGSGIDVVYPHSNDRLYDSILNNGLIISEYPPGDEPMKWHFPRRNRIISGLSRGVLVTQAPKKSGSLITARLARDEGRDVFAVPGDIFNYNYAGTNGLIATGAHPVFNVYDILREYPEYSEKKPDIISYNKKTPEVVYKTEKNKDSNKQEEVKDDTADLIGLTSIQKKIYKCISMGIDHVDMLVREINQPPSVLNNELLMMELSGILVSIPGNKYRLKSER